MSERFKMVKFQDQVREEQNRIGLDYIVYSKASKVGEITLDSGLNLILSNDDPMGLLGADILQMYVTEISFFIRKAGATEEKIYQLYFEVMQYSIGPPDLFALANKNADYISK